MAKRKKQKKNQKRDNIIKEKITFGSSVDEEALTRIIANSLIEYDKRKKHIEEDKKEQQQKEFYKLVGVKDYSNERQPKRAIKAFLNWIKVFFNIIFMRAKNIEGTRATFALTKVFVFLMFVLVSACLICFGILLIAFIPLQYIIPIITPIPWYGSVILVILALAAFVFASFFRMASVEIDKLKDINLIFCLLSAIVSILSVILAVIAAVI